MVSTLRFYQRSQNTIVSISGQCQRSQITVVLISPLIRLCLRGPYFFCGKGSSKVLPRVPRSLPGGPPAILIRKNHRSSFVEAKQSCKKRNVFPVKNFVTLLCIVSSWSFLLPGRLAEVVCDKLSFEEARGASMR